MSLFSVTVHPSVCAAEDFLELELAKRVAAQEDTTAGQGRKHRAAGCQDFMVCRYTHRTS